MQGKDVFDTLTDTGTQMTINAQKTNCEYFPPEVNIAYETYKFRQAKQLAGETLDSYHTRL